MLPPERTRDWREDWRVCRRLEVVRSAYVDLDRMVSGEGLHSLDVRLAVGSYAMTLREALTSLGLPYRPGADPTPGLAFA
ncbi:hypothetical protein [Streptomyces bullii]|uniref:Uncharacterized protein n=1 Tax=Streptomyces bullii TaxID=349910 RepID=A0ABW0USM8_9ACTN